MHTWQSLCKDQETRAGSYSSATLSGAAAQVHCEEGMLHIRPFKYKMTK